MGNATAKVRLRHWAPKPNDSTASRAVSYIKNANPIS